MLRRIVLVLVLVGLVIPISTNGNYSAHAQGGCGQLQTGQSGRIETTWYGDWERGLFLNSAPSMWVNQILGYVPIGETISVLNKACEGSEDIINYRGEGFSWVYVSYKGTLGWLVESGPLCGEGNGCSFVTFIVPVVHAQSLCKDCVPITYGQTISGSFSHSTDSSWWSFQGSRDDVISIVLQARDPWERSDGDFGPGLKLTDPLGKIIADANYDVATRSMAITSAKLPTTGDYIIEAFSTSYEGNYDLTLTLVGSTGSSHASAGCGPAPSRLHIGDAAWVSDYDPSPLDVRESPSKTAVKLFDIPVRQTVTVLAGPTCVGGRTWWQISYQAKIGWVVEVNSNGTYNLIPGTICPIKSIAVDSSLSEGVVEGKVLGEDPCDATIEIHNTRSYWVNLKVIPLGGSKAVAAGGDANLYAKFGILGPDAAVHYTVSFPKPGRSIQVQVDATFGDNAKLMNFVQLITDGVSIYRPESGKFFSLAIDDLPTLLDAFGSTSHLRKAAIAFFSGNQTKAKQEMVAAENAGEFDVLGTTLEQFGFEGGKEAFGKLFKQAGRALGIIEIIWRNAKVYYQFFLSGKSAAGSVMFVAQ